MIFYDFHRPTRPRVEETNVSVLFHSLEKTYINKTLARYAFGGFLKLYCSPGFSSCELTKLIFLVLGYVEWSTLAPPYRVIKIVERLQHLPIEKIFLIVMNVEPHWYRINTVYIRFQFSNNLLKKCRFDYRKNNLQLSTETTFTRQQCYHEKLSFPSSNSSARLGENKEKKNCAINFHSILLCCQVFKKKGRFLANETTWFS